MKETELKLYSYEAYKNKDGIGYPRTPGHWTSPVTYKNVTRITIIKGYGFGNQSKDIYGKQIQDDEFIRNAQNNVPIKMKTLNGETILINPAYIVTKKDFTMAIRKYYSENKNFETGEYTCHWLLPLKTKAIFYDEYISMHG